MPLILPKPLKEWSGDEIRGILKIFRDFDADKDGQIDEKEVEHLAEAMGVDLNVDDGDKYTKDGKIDPMEFFAFYSGCSPAEASIAFVCRSRTAVRRAKGERLAARVHRSGDQGHHGHFQTV